MPAPSPHPLRRIFRIGLVALFGLLAFIPLTAAEAAKKSFDLPAGPASETLKAFARQAGREIVFSADVVEAVTTNAVRGEFTPSQGIEAMLAGTGLTATQDSRSGAFAVGRQKSVPNVQRVARANSSDRPGRENPKAEEPTGETVVLSPFVVSADADADRYQPMESTSGGRVRVNIFDSSQNVSVIGGEVINDAGATRILDAMKYVAGVSESSIPNGLDRITIRGFLTTLRTLDGITSTSQANIDPFLVDRIEIVKGPNAILAPAGVPGGTINNISKKPVFRDFGNVAVEVGRFDSSRVEFDVNRVAGAEQQLAVRVLAAAQHGDDYWGLPKEFFMVAPMATYRPSATTQVIWQTHFINWKIGNYDGIAIDPTAGTTGEARIYQGVSRFLNIYGSDSYRQDDRIENTLTFLASPAESLSFRLLARHGNQYNENNSGTTLAGGSTSAGTNANSFDPLTGNYTPGLVYATTAPYATTPVAISRTYNRSGSLTDQSSVRYAVQADLVHRFQRDHWQAETLLGYAYNNERGHDFRRAITAPAITLENFVYSPDVVGAISREQQFHNVTRQVFLNEKLTLLGDRLILNGGYSRNYWDLEVNDRLAGKVTKASPAQTLVSYGLVFKPVHHLALFYSHAQNAAPLPVANIAAGAPPTQDGEQNEVGLRLRFREDRIRFSVSYYDIKQSNTNVPNPANFAFPPPVPALPGLLADRTARGWEIEAQGALTRNLSLIAAYTDYTNRNPFGQEFRGAAEQAWSALLHYDFESIGPLRGFSCSLGADYLSKRAGDDASGFTVANVARKPTFYLPARTLVNLALAYHSGKRWRAQLNVDNLFNTEYLAASLSRGIVWPGTPANVKLKLTFEF
jgi:iron complex outermembrane receptor protein